MVARKKLLIVSNMFPFGTWHDRFFDAEYEMLAGHFDVTILSLANKKNLPKTEMKSLAGTLDIYDSRKPLSRVYVRWLLKSLPLAFKGLITDLRSAAISRNKADNIKKVLRDAAALAVWIFRTPDQILDPRISSIYSQWGSNIGFYSMLLGKFLDRETVIRYHRYDIYENRLIVTFNRELGRCHNKLLKHVFLGASAALYAKKKFRIAGEKVIAGLFVRDQFPQLSHEPSDGISIVTISSDSSNKRLNLIDETLIALSQLTNQEVRWTHIGNLGRNLHRFGSRREDGVKRLALGVLGQNQLNTALGSKFDFCLFMSNSEGIPYSMLQAMSAGIPVFSSDVGAIADVGDLGYDWLFGSETPADEVAKRIVDQLDVVRKSGTRERVRKHALELFGKDKTVNVLIAELDATHS